MTQHTRRGTEARKIRKRRADERASYWASLTDDERETIAAANKAEYDDRPV